MPLAASPNFYCSSAKLGSGSNLKHFKAKDQHKASTEEFRQGKDCRDSKGTTYQSQRVSAMVERKHEASGNVEIFTKLPSQRILEVLGATQPSKHLEPEKKLQSNSPACVPMTVAVAEFKGPEVHGVVRFAQDSSGQQACSIEAVIDGLAPGAHGWSVHEFGDLTKGPLSTGPAYILPPSLINRPAPQQERQGSGIEGNLGSLLVDSKGHVQSTATNDRLIVADVIGRSVVLYGVSTGADEPVHTRVAAAVIARSALPSSLNPQLCNCDGSLLWQGNSC